MILRFNIEFDQRIPAWRFVAELSLDNVRHFTTRLLNGREVRQVRVLEEMFQRMRRDLENHVRQSMELDAFEFGTLYWNQHVNAAMQRSTQELHIMAERTRPKEPKIVPPEPSFEL